MNVDQYELIDTLEKTISTISRNETIDRATVLRCLKQRLSYQQRRIDNLLAIGWIGSAAPIEQLGGDQHNGF